MMYPFLTLNDETEIVHSELKPNGQVRVYLEKPDEKDGFHNASCFLPDYRWENINGFSEEEIAYYQSVIENSSRAVYSAALVQNRKEASI